MIVIRENIILIILVVYLRFHLCSEVLNLFWALKRTLLCSELACDTAELVVYLDPAAGLGPADGSTEFLAIDLKPWSLWAFVVPMFSVMMVVMLLLWLL